MNSTATKQEGKSRMFSHSSKEKRGFRWWLHWGLSQCFRIEVYWFRGPNASLRFAIDTDGENTVSGQFCTGIFDFYYSLDSCKLALSPWFVRICGGAHLSREWEIRIHDFALWIDYGKAKPSYEGGGDWSFHPLDFLFGRMRSRVELLFEGKSEIFVPEGFGYEAKSYDCTVRNELIVRWRSRFPFKRKYSRWEVEVDGGVPHPGKGTTDYNCGESGLQSSSGSYCDMEEAKSAFVETVLKYRRTYPL